MRVSTATYAALAIQALRRILRKTIRPYTGDTRKVLDVALYGLYSVHQRHYFVIAITSADEESESLDRACKEIEKVLDKCIVSYTGTRLLEHPDIQRITGWTKRVPVSFSEVSSMPPSNVERALSNVLRNHLKDYDPVCF